MGCGGSVPVAPAGAAPGPRAEEKRKSAFRNRADRKYRAAAQLKATTRAAVKIQLMFRRFQARKELKARKTAAAEAKASRRKTPFRGKQDRKARQEQQLAVTTMAAIKIQAMFKGWRVRKAAAERAREEDAGKRKGAFRGARDRRHRAREQLVQATAAAIKIQAMFKGWKARRAVKAKSVRLADAKAGRGAFRGVAARKERAARHLEVTTGAAIKIQAVFRGFKARKAHRVGATGSVPVTQVGAPQARLVPVQY